VVTDIINNLIRKDIQAIVRNVLTTLNACLPITFDALITLFLNISRFILNPPWLIVSYYNTSN